MFYIFLILTETFKRDPRLKPFISPDRIWSLAGLRVSGGISTAKWDEQVARKGETIPTKKPAQHLIAEVPRRQARVEMTIDVDLGDIWSHYCTLNHDGEVVDRGRFRTTPKAIGKWFTDLPPTRAAMEAGVCEDALMIDPVACPSPDIGPPASCLRSTLMHGGIALNGRGAVDVLDEQHFVADLVIEELVDGASGEEETEAAGW